MASINTIVKRKQYLWLGIVVVGTASAIGGALYLSDVDMSGKPQLHTHAVVANVTQHNGEWKTLSSDKVGKPGSTSGHIVTRRISVRRPARRRPGLFHRRGRMCSRR